MPGKNFFDEEEAEETETAPETFKLGDKEYSQDDLSRLVGLGEIAAEAEAKYNTKIDRVFPEYTKATQERKQYKEELEALKAQASQPAVNPVTGELTLEQRNEAIRQLRDLGFEPGINEEKTRQIYREEMAANDLLKDVTSIIEDAKDNGQPATTQSELLQFMAEEGIKNPSRAYKLMFEEQLDALKEQKLANLRPSGMVTTSSSQAGAKQPAPVKVTRSNLASLVQSALGGE